MMIDILKQKPLFPLKNFEDVEKLFRFNLNENYGKPNLALLSIVAGLIEHSLVSITDTDDLLTNSRPVNHRNDVAQKKFVLNRVVNSSSSHHHHLSSTSNEIHKEHQQTYQNDQAKEIEFNEAGYVSSDDSNRSEASTPDLSAIDNLNIPEIEYEIVETLYKRFVDQFKGSIEFKDTEIHKTNLQIKRISDSVWEHLTNSYYKDKAHLQSVFSYLTTSKLDCFGLALAVIAGCQILNLEDIYLALSEDHAWVMFNLKPEELKVQKEKELEEFIENGLPIPTCALHGTCEVTWHGKANSDKRGQSVTYKNCWLYTNGYAVRCDIRLCVAALVNSINPTINANTDSETLALLQQRLLWLLFDQKIYFPMSLGNLGELESICPTPKAPLTPHELFNLGIQISRVEYNDSHVYPYSYLASFFYKRGRYKEALETWADASAVMTKYNYSRVDEEIYNEFSKVANNHIPSMFKELTPGGLEPGKVSTKPILQDPECLALILKFYDNICCWEEGSSTPVLHTVWAGHFGATVLKFSSIIGSRIKLFTEEEWIHNKACASECEVSSRNDQCSSTAADQPEVKGEKLTKDVKIKAEPYKGNEEVKVKTSEVKRSNEDSKSRKRAHSFDNNVDTSESCVNIRSNDHISSTRASPDNIYSKASIKYSEREKRFEVDNDNNVTIILKSRKIAGLRDLLQAGSLNKSAIELQLSAQSQCAPRGRSNSSSYNADFISSVPASMGGSTRSKRLHR